MERSRVPGSVPAPCPSRCSTRARRSSRSTPSSARAVGGARRAARFILGPEVAAFEARVRGVRRGARTRSASPTARTRITLALRALGVGPGDEVVVPSFTFYASAEAIPPTGARPVFCDVDPATFCVTPETVRAGAHAAHEGGAWPCTCSATSRRSREIEALGVPVRRGRRAGGRLDAGRTGGPARWARWRRSPSSPPRTSARSATAARSRPATTTLAERVRMLRFHGSRDKVDLRSRSATTRAWTSCRRRSCACCCPHLDDWCDGRRAAGARTRRPGWASSCALPRPTPGADAGLAPVRGPPRARGRARWRRCRRARDRRARLLPRAGPPPARDARVRAGRGSTCRAPTRPRARTWRSR